MLKRTFVDMKKPRVFVSHVDTAVVFTYEYSMPPTVTDVRLQLISISAILLRMSYKSDFAVYLNISCDPPLANVNFSYRNHF